MKQREEDLVIGKAQEPKKEEEELTLDDIIAGIDTAQATYDFIDGIDLQGAEVLTWGLRVELEDAKRKCLEILIKNINLLNEM